MYKYIINPLNKKKINVKSKLGKKILQNYLNLQIGSSHGLGVTSKSKDEKDKIHKKTNRHFPAAARASEIPW